MMQRLSALLRDRAGTVTIELALLAPILAAMLIGLVDISRAYSDKLRLEQVAQRGIEKVMQNSFKSPPAVPLEAAADAEAGTGADATVTFWLECDGEIQTGASAYTTPCPEGEQHGRYVQIAITKTYTPLIMNTSWELDGVAGIRIQ